MTDPKPLPCPFCGADDVLIARLTPARSHSVDCGECGGSAGCARSEAEAWAKWNERAPRLPEKPDGWMLRHPDRWFDGFFADKSKAECVRGLSSDPDELRIVEVRIVEVPENLSSHQQEEK